MSDNAAVIMVAANDAEEVQFKKFPNEVIARIFFYYRTIMAGLVIDQVKFDIFQRMQKFKKLRQISHSVLYLVTADFYRNNTFVFKPASIGDLPMLRQLPPVQYRKHLRRVQIHLELRDWKKVQGGPAQLLVTSADWLTNCNGARQLQRLTELGTGFDNLIELELRIDLDLRFRDTFQDTLDIIAGANLVIQAKKLSVVFGASGGLSYSKLAILAQLLGSS